jgi:hypothetical protein
LRLLKKRASKPVEVTPTLILLWCEEAIKIWRVEDRLIERRSFKRFRKIVKKIKKKRRLIKRFRSKRAKRVKYKNIRVLYKKKHKRVTLAAVASRRLLRILRGFARWQQKSVLFAC